MTMKSYGATLASLAFSDLYQIWKETNLLVLSEIKAGLIHVRLVQ